MTKPESPTDWTEIDEGWDDPASPGESPPSGTSQGRTPPDLGRRPAAHGSQGLASMSPAASVAPAEAGVPPSQARTKPKIKSKAERAAKAERKAAKQAARRAERRARAQNQKRPAPRKSAGNAPPAKARSRSQTETVPGPVTRIGARAATLLATRGRVILTIAACVLLLAGLVWFLGFRHGGTLSAG